MRSNLIFVILLALLGGLVAGVIARPRTPHVQAHVAPVETTSTSAAHSPSAPTSSDPSKPASTSTAATSGASKSGAAAPVPLSLKRTLRVSSLGWEHLLAGVAANGGLTASANSTYKKHGLAVSFTTHATTSALQGALARGGSDPEGADIAILSLPRFVATYERLKALDPVVFYVTSWSEGAHVVVSKVARLSKLRPGKIFIKGNDASASYFTALFGLGLQGIDPGRLNTTNDDNWDLLATERANGLAVVSLENKNLALSTTEASRLVPYVAVAPRMLLTDHPRAALAFIGGWAAGQTKVQQQAANVARMITKAENAPEPLAILSALGQLSQTNLLDNARLFELAGRSTTPIAVLFDETWATWRGAKVLGSPPEKAPIESSVVAALVRRGGSTQSGSSTSPTAGRIADGDPIIVHRLEVAVGKAGEQLKAREDAAKAVSRVAGTFRRCPIRVAWWRHGAVDKKETQALLELMAQRYDLVSDRLSVGKARATGKKSLVVEVLPIP